MRVGALPLSDLNSWLEEYEFPILIKAWRKEIMVEGWKRFKLSVKLKLLKQKIKDWVKSNLGEAEQQKAFILEEIQKIDLIEESTGNLRDEDRLKRSCLREVS